MAIRKINPTSPGQRGMTKSDYQEITCTTPEKSLLKSLKKTAGRNNTGRITCRHKGGGVKRTYRIIDFKREKFGVPATVKTIEYDPNRNVRITIVHNIELTPGRGGVMVRSAGNAAQVMAKEGNYVTIKLPSSEMRMVRKECMATIGTLGNAEFKNLSIGKAGRKRYLGIRPTVRGVTMNPCDHPHGGGEGKTGPGGHPKTPWGKPALGHKTRKSGKASDKLIVRRRKK